MANPVPASLFTFQLSNGTMAVVAGDSFTWVSIICNTTTQGTVIGNWQTASGIQSTALDTFQGVPINMSAATGLPLEITITAPAGCTIQIIAS